LIVHANFAIGVANKSQSLSAGFSIEILAGITSNQLAGFAFGCKQKHRAH